GRPIARIGPDAHDFARRIARVNIRWIIDVELHQVRRRDHSVSPISLIEGRRGIEVRAQAGIGVADAMDCSLDLRLFGTVVFDDVDLAATWPRDAVVSQQPERRPNALAGRNLDARLHPAVGKLFPEAS